MTRKGFLITFEGVDGAGKSSLIQVLKNKINDLDLEVSVTREPGGTAFAESIRRVLIEHTEQVGVLSELLALYSARADHVQQKLLPELSKKTVVLCDRFYDSSFAYQAKAKGVDPRILQQLNSWVVATCIPDITFFIDVPIAVCMQRGALRGVKEVYDNSSEAFFKRVREGFLEQAKTYPSRIHTLTATEDCSTQQLAQECWKILLPRLSSL